MLQASTMQFAAPTLGMWALLPCCLISKYNSLQHPWILHQDTHVLGPVQPLLCSPLSDSENSACIPHSQGQVLCTEVHLEVAEKVVVICWGLQDTFVLQCCYQVRGCKGAISFAQQCLLSLGHDSICELVRCPVMRGLSKAATFHQVSYQSSVILGLRACALRMLLEEPDYILNTACLLLWHGAPFGGDHDGQMCDGEARL